VLWLRAILFTILAPGMIAGLAPLLIKENRPLPGGIWNAGWVLVLIGACTYLHCLLRFLAAHGTPAIFFTRPLRFVIGEEPTQLVRGGAYRYSRNPMYFSVLTAIFGQAVVFKSLAVATFGSCLCVFFHIVVVFAEEPHLRAREGHVFEEYCRQTPRWIKLW
jgi:protein-S-isoprenylcysteine O-methyltransferase Ste14